MLFFKIQSIVFVQMKRILVTETEWKIST